MRQSHKAVFGIYHDRTNLERAVDQLKSEGFRNSDISVMFPDEKSSQEFAQEKHTKAPEGAATGAGTGLAIGGALGWLVGIGTLAIPGIGPFIAAGPIMSALAGAGMGGAVGTLAGALIGMGIPEYEAKNYEESIKKGGFLLSVHSSDRLDLLERAQNILNSTGAEQISGTRDVSMDYQPSGQEGTAQDRDVQGQTIRLKPGEEVIIGPGGPSGPGRIEKKKTA